MSKIIKNVLSLGFANIFAQLFAFLFIMYYTKILNQDSVGLINLAQSILVYFTMMTLYGLQTYGTREIAKHKDNIEDYVQHIIMIRLIIACVSFLLLIVISIGSNKGSSFTYIVILYGLTLFPTAFNLDWVYSGISEMQHNAVYNSIKSFTPFILLILFLRENNNIFIIPICTFLGVFLASIYHLIIYKKKNFKFKISFDSEKIMYYLREAFPFFLSGMLSMINCNVDSIIIGFLIGNQELAIYSTGYKIIFFLINLISIIFIPIFPNLISYYNNRDMHKLEILLSYLGKIIVMIATPILVGSIMLSKEIMVFLFKEEYVASATSFNILSVYIFILFLRETYAYSLNAWGKEKFYLKVVSISSIINLVLNFILIPRFGINAAAVTTVISELFNLFLMRKEACKIVKISYINSLYKIILPVAIMAVGIKILSPFHVLIKILLSIIIYFSSILLFKYISIKELKSIVNKKSN
ncbi:flippase [Hathewaya histolytica]